MIRDNPSSSRTSNYQHMLGYAIIAALIQKYPKSGAGQSNRLDVFGKTVAIR
jgi:hypothetical protein